MKQSFYSHGKLLLCGEYAVLDGATALAVPTRLGQWLRIFESETGGVEWCSKNPDGSPWFTTHFEKDDFKEVAKASAFPSGTRERLLYMLKAGIALNPEFGKKLTGLRVETLLEFPKEWGLGSSSTLISNLGQWAQIDPYKLLHATLGGSGYDIAAALSEGAFFYTLQQGKQPQIAPAFFDPPFADELFFVYLNQKQDSREGIASYRQRPTPSKMILDTISDLSRKMAAAPDLNAFRKAMDSHEVCIGALLGMQPIKSKLFREYHGSIKSLGAWGGDFILATGNSEDADYFREKGYELIRPYREFIL